MLTPKLLLHLGLYFFLSCCYALFSYSLTAPNLILSSWQPYWSFQTWIWSTFFNNAQLLSYTYGLLITGLFINYSFLLLNFFKLMTTLQNWSLIKKMCLVIGLSFPFVFASSALSYDVFNYIFNAKMVLVYGANPHQAVALDYSYDLWTRFMHNTHTPAPYGYGWTFLSLVPYFFGFGKLLVTWFNFKLFGWLSYILLSVVYFKFLGKNWLKSLVVVLNPLVLIEIVGNSHNDLWMLVPAISSMLLISKVKKITITSLLLPSVLLLISIAVKLVTVALLPIFVLLLVANSPSKKPDVSTRLLRIFTENWPVLVSFGLFLPLFLERSKWFLPWYITWSLVWLPFFKKSKSTSISLLKLVWSSIVIGFSISSMYRYLPFLSSGGYEPPVLSQQILISWLGGFVLSFVVFFSIKKFKNAS